jgi:hypothetical protein
MQSAITDSGGEASMSMSRLHICTAAFVSVSILAPPISAQAPVPNTEALVASINNVRVLSFETDAPVREVRAVVDGEVVDTYLWHDAYNGIDVAVIRGSRDQVRVEVQVGNVGGILNFTFPRNIRANVAEPESYGPGRRLTLGDWVELFSVRQVMNGRDVLTTMRIEVR